MYRSIIWVMVGCLLLGCGRDGGSSAGRAGGAPEFRIVSGSENETLEPLVKQFADRAGVTVEMSYMGSVDISREIEKGKASDYDAVWPAASIWIALGDSQNVVKSRKSIMRSPVVFGIKSSLAEKLNWTKQDVTVSEILRAVEDESLRFAMTSATQSNSGASWYLGCLSAFAGQPEVLTSENLQNDEVRKQIRRFLGSVDRSSGSSGWLKTLMVERYNRFDAMVNYEALVIEANRELLAAGREPLYVVYPIDGLTIADSPLGYVEKGDAAKRQFFDQLQSYLLSTDVQQQIARLGRRAGLVGTTTEDLPADAFNPAWGINPERVLSPIRMPNGDVIREALVLYQTAFRKPSLTAFVLDYSGSMQGEGESQLKEAMFTLLDEEESARYLLQPSAEDVTIVIPFNAGVIDMWRAEGNDPSEFRQLLGKIEQQSSGGGTQMYEAAAHALETIAPLANSGKYHTSIILMSDGASEGSLQQFQGLVESNVLSRDVPIYTILFGQADPSQMKPLAEWSGGRMFDGRNDVVQAFRKAKGYN